MPDLGEGGIMLFYRYKSNLFPGFYGYFPSFVLNQEVEKTYNPHSLRYLPAASFNTDLRNCHPSYN
jgi:hypothetical protein